MTPGELVATIEALGGELRPRGEEVDLGVPAGVTIPVVLFEGLQEGCVETIQYLRDVARQRHWATDPRPDLMEDTGAWQTFLGTLYEQPGAEHQLFGALHFARCLGARLQRTESGLRLVPGEMSQGEYGAIREAVLTRYGRVLTQLLLNS